MRDLAIFFLKVISILYILLGLLTAPITPMGYILMVFPITLMHFGLFVVPLRLIEQIISNFDLFSRPDSTTVVYFALNLFLSIAAILLGWIGFKTADDIYLNKYRGKKIWSFIILLSILLTLINWVLPPLKMFSFAAVAISSIWPILYILSFYIIAKVPPPEKQ